VKRAKRRKVHVQNFQNWSRHRWTSEIQQSAAASDLADELRKRRQELANRDVDFCERVAGFERFSIDGQLLQPLGGQAGYVRSHVVGRRL
jgi:hypothetical protein